MTVYVVLALGAGLLYWFSILAKTPKRVMDATPDEPQMRVEVGVKRPRSRTFDNLPEVEAADVAAEDLELLLVRLKSLYEAPEPQTLGQSRIFSRQAKTAAVGLLPYVRLQIQKGAGQPWQDVERACLHVVNDAASILAATSIDDIDATDALMSLVWALNDAGVLAVD